MLNVKNTESSLLFPNHYDGAQGDEQAAGDDFRGEWFLQDDKRQQNGKYYAELVDGRYSRHIAELEALEIEQP